MILRDLFQNVSEDRIIARAIFEDCCKLQDVNSRIEKYYVHLVKLKSANYCKSDMMFYMSVEKDEDSNSPYASVSGFLYDDIKADKECYYGIAWLDYNHYSSLYVPDYMVWIYGEEIVASEALREYGWNGYNAVIICPDEVKIRVLRALDNMKSELFLTDSNYYDRCRKQFCMEYCEENLLREEIE